MNKPLLSINKRIGRKEALLKLQRYCAYQDRCHKEVRDKLANLGYFGYLADELMVELIEDDFLNEERYARSFVRGKHRIKGWGRHKLRHALSQKGINGRLTDKALEEINPDDYVEKLGELCRKKRETIELTKDFEIKAKLRSYLMSRGYEIDLINEAIENLP